MAGVGGQAALAFPLGGEGIAISAKPWLVNLSPQPDTTDVSLLSRVQFSARDVETFIDLGTVHAVVGYAHVFSHGDNYFDYLPRTTRGSIFDGPFVGTPNVTLDSGGGVRIEKTSNYLQRSVYFTAIDVAGLHYPSGMVSAEIQPEIENQAPALIGPLNQPIFPGIMPPAWMNERLHIVSGVLALEHGPRNTGLYLFFVNLGTIASPIPVLRIAGPEVDGVSVPDVQLSYNWYGKHRYFLLWNEHTNEAEVFVDINGMTTRIFHTPFLDLNGALTFNQYVPGSNNFQRHAGDLDFVAVYGQEGRSGSRMIINSISVASDVGCPVRGLALSGDWITTRVGAELVKYPGSVDPRQAPVSSWFDTPETIISNPDPDGVKKMVGKAFRLAKVTESKSLSIYRQEPGLLRSVETDPPTYETDGFLLETNFFATCSQLITSGTGMGFLIFDGSTVYHIGLFDDSRIKTIGLLQKGGDPLNVNHNYIPWPAVNWSSPVGFRFTVDPRRGRFEIFNENSYLSPALTQVFSRAMLPSGKDYKVLGQLPFIALGHPAPYGTLGSFDLYSLNYCHVYQAWESRTEANPTTDGNPAFTTDGTGTVIDATSSTPLTIVCSAGQKRRYYRTASFDTDRGVIVEAHCRVTSYKPRCRTGAYIIIADGLRTHMLSFVDTDAGKFACLALSHNLNSFWEYAGYEGLGAQTSFPCDWTQDHRYKFIYEPNTGISVYLDYETTPRLFIPKAEAPAYPLQLPDLPPDTPVVGFGHFSPEGSTSEWKYFRTFCSTGYEVSTRKNEPDDVLVEDLFGNEALVVVHAMDED